MEEIGFADGSRRDLFFKGGLDWVIDEVGGGFGIEIRCGFGYSTV